MSTLFLQQIFTNPMILGLFLAWSMIWKGISLWRAARKDSKPWFIALLVINTAGILDILYIFVFSKMQSKSIHESVK